jgi:2-C-methyl-D-erythritol 4-phosphate cytidylyltransferase/2-C-methyl-D-erythritol 2,4-cyclodiphosphate synthase
LERRRVTQDVLQVSLIVVAAGSGTRLGGDVPKQYRLLAGRPLLSHTLEALLAAHAFSAARVVTRAADDALYRRAVAALPATLAASLSEPVLGGATRQDSVRAGLEALEPCDLVLIHDGARPFPTVDLVRRAIDAAARHGAAVPGLTPSDTLKEIDEAGAIVATPPRANLRAVQTPQAFRFPLILDAHRRAAAAGRTDLTDDAAAAEWAGHRVHVFEGERGNIKVTTMQDFAMLEAQRAAATADVRVGQGFDVHAFAPGDHVWLGGVRIPHGAALTGHSDADVALHAITDALLGAIGDGDIGAHFPPSDPRWRGARSRIFLEDAVRRVRERGGMIAHIDATIICEAPKIGPHREAMRAAIAEITGVALERVAVKATTSERLGFTGRGEGIAAMATTTVRLPIKES